MRIIDLRPEDTGTVPAGSAKLGFGTGGVMPDANGWGKPDICLAKRVRA